MQHKTVLSTIAIEKIIRGKYQPRAHFNQEELQKLALSIKNNGLLQPIVVRINKDVYEIVAGERRWRAAQLAGLQTISCIIQDYSDIKAAQMAIIENTIRSDLNPIEEAISYKIFIEKFNLNHEEIASIVGKSRSGITNTLRLLSLHSKIQEMIVQKQLSEGHGKIIASLPMEIQKQFALKCYKLGWSVRQLEVFIKSYLNNSKSTNQKKKDVNLEHLEKLLSQHCATTVHIQHNKGKGYLKIKFSSHDSLNSILKKLNFDVNKI